MSANSTSSSTARASAKSPSPDSSTPPEISKLATELFGNWKSPGTYTRITNMYKKIEPADKKIETPDKQNAFFIAGEMVKINDEDPDYPALVMADYMFGASGLGTRLSRRIRDKEGLSYVAQSNFGAPTKDDGGNFLAVAISNPQNAPKVEASFRDELAKTLKEGFTADEVAAAKKAWLQERGMGRSEDGALVGLLRGPPAFRPHPEVRRIAGSQGGRAHSRADQRRLPQAHRPGQPDLREGRRLQESRRVAVGQDGLPGCLSFSQSDGTGSDGLSYYFENQTAAGERALGLHQLRIIQQPHLPPHAAQ